MPPVWQACSRMHTSPPTQVVSTQPVGPAQERFPPGRWQEGLQLARPEGIPSDDHASRGDLGHHGAKDFAGADLSLQSETLTLVLPNGKILLEDPLVARPHGPFRQVSPG